MRWIPCGCPVPILDLGKNHGSASSNRLVSCQYPPVPCSTGFDFGLMPGSGSCRFSLPLILFLLLFRGRIKNHVATRQPLLWTWGRRDHPWQTDFINGTRKGTSLTLCQSQGKGKVNVTTSNGTWSRTQCHKSSMVIQSRTAFRSLFMKPLDWTMNKWVHPLLYYLTSKTQWHLFVIKLESLSSNWHLTVKSSPTGLRTTSGYVLPNLKSHWSNHWHLASLPLVVTCGNSYLSSAWSH